MIEKKIIDYLDGKVDELVAVETPRPAPAEYILIERVGGGEVNHIKSASIAFQSYADSLYEAASINEKIKKLLPEMIELGDISSVKLESDYNFTDTQTKKYRYQSIFKIVYY